MRQETLIAKLLHSVTEDYYKVPYSVTVITKLVVPAVVR